MSMRTIIICLLFLVVWAIASGQQLSPDERDILTLQDQRSLGDGRLLAYLGHGDSNLRYRAAIALANLQDTATAKSVLPLLQDSESRVRAAAAFALGQIGSSIAQDSLLGCLRVETSPVVISRVLEALGKIGDESALDEVVAYRPLADTASLKAEIALSVARFALRDIRNERSMWLCFDLCGDPDSRVRWSALNALWRAAPHGLIDVEIAKRADELTKLVSDPDPDVRANLLTLLSRSKSSDALDLFRKAQKAERQRPDWRAQVQLVRSLAAFVPDNADLVGEFNEYLNADNDHVKIAALQSIAGLSKEVIQSSNNTTSLRQAILKLVGTKNPTAELTRGEAFVALAKFFPDDFGRKNYLADKELTQREKTKVIEGLSLVPTGRSFSIIMNSLEDSSVRVAMAAWDFVRRFLTPSVLARIRAGDPDWVEARNALYRKTLGALQRGDMALTHLVSNCLGDTAYFGMFRDAGQSDSVVLALNGSFRRLTTPDDVEAMQSALGAIGNIRDARFIPTLKQALKDPDRTVATLAAAALSRITHEDYTAEIPKTTRPVRSDYDWETFESIKPAQRVSLMTNKGLIELQLLKEDAPFTVLSFVKLVRKGFYKGLTFHRVIPNFVVQGGDPRGDGWGGPGYAIRSEFSLVNFERGMVGIASAGKDTEGCQFFITHSPAPHLDGRYTIFAKVVEGQDVVDRIQAGDTITDMSLE
jgi:peptidylprolyl isomerase